MLALESSNVPSPRTAAQWIGPSLEDISSAMKSLTIEMNSTTDNPLIETETKRIHHGGILFELTCVDTICGPGEIPKRKTREKGVWESATRPKNHTSLSVPPIIQAQTEVSLRSSRSWFRLFIFFSSSASRDNRPEASPLFNVSCYHFSARFLRPL